MAEIVVPFRIDDADVNLLDGTPIELANIGSSDELVRVPTRIELWREAGTAYTLQPAKGTILAPNAMWGSYSGVRCSSCDTGRKPSGTGFEAGRALRGRRSRAAE